MPGLIDVRTGEAKQVAEDQIPAYLASGQFAFDPSQTYRLRNPDGELVPVAGDVAGAAIERMGFRFGSEGERTEELRAEGEEDYYESTGQQILTGIEGAAGGLTLGLSRLGATEDEKKRKAYNPGIATGGEIVGSIAPAFVGGGGVGFGRALAMSPAGLASRAGRAIAGEGSVARAAVGYGLEGALYSSGQVISDIALTDKELSAEAFLGDEVFTGALIGGGFGAALTGGAKAYRAFKRPAPDPRIGSMGDEAVAGIEPATSTTPTMRIEYEGELPGQIDALVAPKPPKVKPGRDTLAESYDANPGAIEAAAAKAKAAEQKAFEKARTVRDASPEYVSADELVPKHEQGTVNLKKSAGRVVDELKDHRAVADEIADLADVHVSVPLNQRGAGFTEELRVNLDQYRAASAQLDEVLARGGGWTGPAGEATMGFERQMIDRADDLANRGLISPADAERAKRAAYQYGKDIANRRRLAWHAGGKESPAGFDPVAAKAAAQEPGRELGSAMNKRLQRIGDIDADRAAFGQFGGRASEIADDIIGKPTGTVAGKVGAKKKPAIPEGWSIHDGEVPIGPRRARVLSLDELEAKGAPKRKPTTLYPEADFPGSFPRPGTPEHAAYLNRMARQGRDTGLGPMAHERTTMHLGPTVRVEESFAKELDAIADFEAASNKLYSTMKPHLPPHLASRAEPRFAPYRELEAKHAAKSERFASFKDALGGIELLSMAGVPGIPDVDKIPVVGPILGMYAKWRLLKAAGTKFGVLKGSEAAVAQQSSKVRNRLSDGINSFLAGAKRAGGKAKPAVVPSTAVILGSPIFDAAEQKKAADKKATEKAKAGLRAADLYKKRAAELRHAQAVGNEALRKVIQTADPAVQEAIEKAWSRKIDFLISKLPIDPTPPNAFGLPSTWEPSPQQLHEFAQYVRGATQLSNVMDDLMAGTLTPQAVEAFEAVAPALFNEVRSLLVSRAAEIGEGMSYGQKVKLSIMLKEPIVPSMRPEYIAAQQEGYAKDAEQPPQPPPQVSFAGPGLAQQEMWGPFTRAGK